MEYNYWLGRSVHAFGMAQSATSATARLIHLQLAGAYSVRAADREERPADWNAIGRASPQAPAAAPSSVQTPSSGQTGRRVMSHEAKRPQGHAPGSGSAAPAPASPLSYAEYLREREHHCRQSAAASARQDVRRTYLGFARYYERMAEDVER